MRYGMRCLPALAGLLALVWSSPAIGGGPATDERASPGRPFERHSLADDPAYLDQGAITNMRTCLAVADDRQSTRLWRETFGGGDDPDLESNLAEWLASDWALRKTEPGFGTLLACAQVVAAWHSALPDRTGDAPPEDGRIEHGAVVLDLGYEVQSGPHTQMKSAVIKPGPLVRLLTSQGLLPGTAFGGIIVRNATIDGTLLLYNLRLSIPVTFVNTTFKGSAYSKAVFQQKDIEKTALSIVNSHFADRVLIINSEMCGDVRIHDNKFSENLELVDVEQSNAECDDPEEDAFAHIGTTHFMQSLRIIRSRFGNFYMTGSVISSLLMSSNDFGGEMSLQDNDIGTLQSQSPYLAREVSISYNRIENDFFIEGFGKPEAAMGRIRITSNRIGGGFGFKFPKESLPPALDFRSNHVGNGSQICLPPSWPGDVTLAGSSYAGTLAIGLEAGASGASGSDEAPCPGRFEGAAEELAERLDGTYCRLVEEHGPKLTVSLMATDIRTLKWHMPLSCDYRWSGFGLSYDLWLPHPDAEPLLAGGSNGADWTRTAFRAWRTTLSAYEPASLDMMSRYLAGKGAYVASREMQIEAKRLNYAPDCPPHEDLGYCAAQILGLLDPLGLIAARAATPGLAGDVGPSLGERVSEALRRAWRAFQLVLLWPGGYGAKPERALLLLLGGMVGFALLYWGYVWSYRARYRRLLRSARQEVARLSARMADSGQGQERAAKIASAIDMLSESADHQRAMAILRQDVIPDIASLAARHRLALPSLDELRRRSALPLGTTEVFGFSRFNEGQMPARFTPLRYSVDTMIPVIDLHAYSSYYPEWWPMRGVTVIQHICGWWWLTVFVASAAIL